MASPSEVRHGDTRHDEWDSDAKSHCDSDFESDDEETLQWAAKLLGLQPSPRKSPTLKIRMSTEKLNIGSEFGDEQGKNSKKNLNKKKKKKKKPISLTNRTEFDEEKAMQEMEEERRKREEAKPLTPEEIRRILGDDAFSEANQRNWVRRSVRQPSKALLNTKPVKMLIDKLNANDPDMVVLKMKKYVNDPNAPSAVIDAALNAMELNTNCQALYIQVRTMFVLDFFLSHYDM
jgi:hypothetical protein